MQIIHSQGLLCLLWCPEGSKGESRVCKSHVRPAPPALLPPLTTSRSPQLLPGLQLPPGCRQPKCLAPACPFSPNAHTHAPTRLLDIAMRRSNLQHLKSTCPTVSSLPPLVSLILLCIPHLGVSDLATVKLTIFRCGWARGGASACEPPEIACRILLGYTFSFCFFRLGLKKRVSTELQR